mgnify:CR=1 FL=1
MEVVPGSNCRRVKFELAPRVLVTSTVSGLCSPVQGRVKFDADVVFGVTDRFYLNFGVKIERMYNLTHKTQDVRPKVGLSLEL